jgi:hypothetical protein
MAVLRHGHPRLKRRASSKAWMAGTSTAMTMWMGHDQRRLVSVMAAVMMVIIIMPVRMYPQHTIDATNDAPRHPTDNCANRAADRSQHTMANMPPLVRSFARTLSDTLRLRSYRHGKNNG